MLHKKPTQADASPSTLQRLSAVLRRGASKFYKKSQSTPRAGRHGLVTKVIAKMFPCASPRKKGNAKKPTTSPPADADASQSQIPDRQKGSVADTIVIKVAPPSEEAVPSPAVSETSKSKTNERHATELDIDTTLSEEPAESHKAMHSSPGEERGLAKLTPSLSTTNSESFERQFAQFRSSVEWNTPPSEASPKVETHQSPEVDLPIEVERHIDSKAVSASPTCSDERLQDDILTSSSALSISTDRTTPSDEVSSAASSQSPILEFADTENAIEELEIEVISDRTILKPRSNFHKLPSGLSAPSISTSATTSVSLSASAASSNESMIGEAAKDHAFGSTEEEIQALELEIEGCKMQEESGKVNNPNTAHHGTIERVESTEARRERVALGVKARHKRIGLEERLARLREGIAVAKKQVQATKKRNSVAPDRVPHWQKRAQVLKERKAARRAAKLSMEAAKAVK